MKQTLLPLNLYRLYTVLIAFAFSTPYAHAALSGTYSINPGSAASASNYLTITSALSDMVSGTRGDGGTPNGSGVSGAVIFELATGYTSSGETFPLTFGVVSGASGSNTITFRPASGVGSALSFSGSNATAIIDLNNSDYYIIDGRPGGTGSNKYIDISNSSSAPTMRYINDATNNIVRYCLVHSNVGASTGTVLFSTTSQTTGNDDNTIDNCNVYGSTTTNNAIYALGTASKTNSGNTISNCNIYDFFNSSASSSGITLSSNNNAWTINANSFYQTATRTSTAGATHYGILISTGSTGGDFVISNNYIGGNAASAGGSAWTMGDTSYNVSLAAVNINASGGTVTSVQGNTIANLAINTSTTQGTFFGINVVAGNVNIGTTSGNVIGNNSTGSITATTSGSGGIAYGITATTAGTVNIYNNTIGSINAAGSNTGVSSGIYGIYVSGTTGAFTISGNTVGNASTANSLNSITAASGGTGPRMWGIVGSLQNNPNPLKIINNTISNMNSNYTGTGSNSQMLGIFTYLIKDTITGNTISNLSSATAYSAPIYGIFYYLNSINDNYVSGNTIHSLSSTYTGATAMSVYGIGGGGGTITYNGNFIHSLSAAGSGASNLYGLQLQGSGNAITNNMIRLGIDGSGVSVTSGYTIYGIYEFSGPSNFYHNSVYIGGTGVSGTASSAAFYTAVTTGTREILNNIFLNNRSNGAGSGSHYAFRFAGGLGTITMNNNIFYANGTGGVLGRQSTTDYSTLASWQSASSQDANSLNEDPMFNNVTGNASAVNLHLLANTPAESAGATVASVTVDFNAQTRSTLSPIDIGADAGNFANIWTGSWSNGAPASTDDVLISSATAPTTFSCKNLRITNGNTLNTGTNDVVSIYGDIINNGNGVTGTGTLTFTKTGTSAIGTGSDTIAFGGTITVSSGCTFATANKLRLTSDATNTGRIGNSAGSITGNVMAQRYQPGKRCFRFYGHPFSSSIALSQLTDEIDITGTGGATNGFTATTSNNPSAFWFDVTTANTSTAGNNPGWTAFTSASTAVWDRYELLRLLVRGGKGEGLTGAAYTPSAATFEAAGAVNQGTQTITLTKGSGSSFVGCGNPFPSGIQMNAVARGGNVGANYYAWDATSGAAGAYVTNAWTLSYVLPAYAAFFTTVTATDNITVEEADKDTGGAGLFKGTANDNWVELLISDSSLKWDRLLINFDDSSMSVEDNLDAKKLYNPGLDFFTLSKDSTRLAVDVRPYADSTAIPLGLTAYNRYNKYVIKTGMFDIPAGTKLYLHDKYLNKSEELKAGFEYWFDVTTDSLSQGNGRFEINMVGKPTGIISTTGHTAKMQLVPNPAQNEVKVSFDKLDGPAQIRLTGVTGKVVFSAEANGGTGSITIPLQNVPAGIYIVELQSRNARFTEKLIKE